MELSFTALLRLSWVAATLPILIASFPLPFTGFLHRIILGLASRGKIMKPSSSKFTVPQRYFLHFYVVATVLTTSLVIPIWLYAYAKMRPLSFESLHYSTIASYLTGGGSYLFSIQKAQSPTMEHMYRVWRTVFVLLLMEIQVLRRLHETLNVFHYSPSARMHILGYLTGLFFYIGAPLSLSSSCIAEATSYAGGKIAEFIVKGRARMHIEVDWWALVKPLLCLGWCQWVGAAVFIWGWLHQLNCHKILGSLREGKRNDEYVIPHGDWFNYVSSPHYLAEIVIYAGILVASGGSDITVWLLFIFVVANLIFAAAESHRWYKQKFENYPHSRCAIIPFIY
ncbi:polyprenal reductase 1-like [Typha latifolia]|uniref:polyprenal reductase 1-like n=1 Tax=Typha latifolia TaxID=4733 RepID=UPI003C2BA476